MGRVVIAMVILGIVGIVGSVAAASVLFPPPARTVDVTRSLDFAEPIEGSITNGEDGNSPPFDTLLTSERFEPGITFRIARAGARGMAEFCVWHTSDRAIVLGHVMGCVDDVRILRPVATDCGALDERPDAASLAAAILARPGLEAEDRGTLGEAGVPETMFVGGYSGRVVHVPGQRPFDDAVDDPDRCRLLMPPGGEDDTIEVRGDLAARFVMLDVRGELVVIRAGLGGFDAVSGAAAHERGYGGDKAGAKDAIWHLLQSITDIRFG